jgi:hypothetical protein
MKERIKKWNEKVKKEKLNGWNITGNCFSVSG